MSAKKNEKINIEEKLFSNLKKEQHIVARP